MRAIALMHFIEPTCFSVSLDNFILIFEDKRCPIFILPGNWSWMIISNSSKFLLSIGK